MWSGAGAGFDDFDCLPATVFGSIFGGFQQVGALLVVGSRLLGNLLAAGVARRCGGHLARDYVNFGWGFLRCCDGDMFFSIPLGFIV